MENKINSFEDLEAWKSARELVRFIYRIFTRAPANRDFGLRGQVQDAAVSVMTNIAEGFERVHPTEKMQFYNIARASCGEVRSLSYVMLDAEYISAAEHTELLERIVHTGKLVSGLMRSTRARIAKP
ncbi:MAG TPA: four helix bundle protein [Verrucomicrobiae bacterium]|jgi:four helix bundle protein|nr:four helix bundle protein [Verrucomicrobiae bacterium]